ncbi:Uncharacterized protein SCF082_LOCUS27584 [Durusdinium trenchii]|uniref:Lipid-binding serum glycoprotein N-terminal domain-containing protein n=1 Tax=Durusdinium trenchii TaxID=1381693 RepID=A0ABP0MFE1_9DINO
MPYQVIGLALVSLTSFASSASVKNCGGPHDHFSNVSITLSPDPISRATPFTLTIAGSLDEDHIGGTLDVDLEVHALRVVDKAVKSQSSYTVSPGFAKGPMRLEIGPVTLPQDPGEALSDSSGDLKWCGSSADHLKDVSASTSGEVTMITGSLDEDLPSIVANVDLTVRALFVKVPLKLQVPVSFSPAISKGDWKLTVKELTQTTQALNPVKVEGQVVIDDREHQQVTCLSVDNLDRAMVV